MYRYYIDLVARFNVYYFAVLGALLTYAASTDAIATNYLLLAIPLVLSIDQLLNYMSSLKLSNEIHKGKVSFLLKARVEPVIINSNPGSSCLKLNPLFNILLSFIIVHLFLIAFLGWAMWHYSVKPADSLKAAAARECHQVILVQPWLEIKGEKEG